MTDLVTSQMLTIHLEERECFSAWNLANNVAGLEGDDPNDKGDWLPFIQKLEPRLTNTFSVTST